MPLDEPLELAPGERLQRNTLVRKLIRGLDRHAPGEAAHGERVAVYAVATAERMGISDEELLKIRYAATLHDMGKLHIDAQLLLAARPLDADERATIERHVVDFDDLLPDKDFLAGTRPLIRHHHERWSGGGYPDGLVGDEIPVGSRIIAAAETLDVMLAGAPWRPAFSDSHAKHAMSELSGKWFEPAVVDALLDVQSLIQPLYV